MKEKAPYYFVTDEGEIREINITFEKYCKMLHDEKQHHRVQKAPAAD